MKILIIGAKGNLGCQLVEVFRKEEVIAWDREDIDVTVEADVKEKIKQLKPDILINASAYNAVDKCEEEQAEFDMAKKINGEAVGYLADACLENNALFVQYSTDFVFGGDGKNGYVESDKPFPINNYGISKLLGEDEVAKRAKNGLKYYLIRTSKLFGPKGKSAVAKPSFFDIMLELAKSKDELSVVDDELNCFTLTKDLAVETKKLIETKKEYGIYHIANSEPATWYAAVRVLFAIKGIKVKVNPVASDKFPRPAKRPVNSVLLNTKLQPMRGYKEALKDYLN